MKPRTIWGDGKSVRVHETADGEVITSQADADEVAALKVEHGIIDDELLCYLTSATRLVGMSAKYRAVRALFAVGMPLEAIEDWFDLTTEEVKEITKDLRDETIRNLYDAGLHTREIAERLEVNLVTVNSTTRDRARHARTGTGRKRETRPRKNATPAGVVTDVQRWFTFGQCRSGIAEALGLSRTSVYRVTRFLPPNGHERCEHCRPGPRTRRTTITP